MTTINNGPYSRKEELERHILGCLLIDNESCDKISDLLEEKDFSEKVNQSLFKYILLARQKHVGFDIVTILDDMKKIEHPESKYYKFVEEYLFDIIRDTPTAVNILAYVNLLKNES